MVENRAAPVATDWLHHNVQLHVEGKVYGFCLLWVPGSGMQFGHSLVCCWKGYFACMMVMMGIMVMGIMVVGSCCRAAVKYHCISVVCFLAATCDRHMQCIVQLWPCWLCVGMALRTVLQYKLSNMPCAGRCVTHKCRNRT